MEQINDESITFTQILSQANIIIDKLKGLFPRREGNFSTRFILAVIQVCACAFFFSFLCLFVCLVFTLFSTCASMKQPF